jgi:hypothetical protein
MDPMSHEPDERSPESHSEQVPSQIVMPRLARRLFKRGAASLEPTTSHSLEASAISPTSSIKKSSAIRLFIPVFFLIAVFGAAAALGAFLFRWGSASTAASKSFASTDQFDELSALTAGLLGLSVAVAAFTWSAFRRIAKEVGRDPVVCTLLLYVIVSAALILGHFLIERGSAPFPLPHFYQRIGVLAIIVLTGGAGCFCGLVLTAYAQRERAREPGTMIPGHEIRSILVSRSDIHQLFVGEAVLITGSVTVFGGLRGALDADPSKHRDQIAVIPTYQVILYGAFFAGLLAFIVVPAYTAWQAHASGLRDRLYPVPDDGCAVQSWYDGRSNLEALLEMRQGFFSRSLTVLGLLAPLISSIISAVIFALRKLDVNWWLQ